MYLDAALDELVEDAGVVEGLENVTVSGRVPVLESGASKLLGAGRRESLMTRG